MLSVPAEDCLLEIFRLEERNVTPSTSLLAKTLGVRDSTMTVMVQRLSQSGLVNYRLRKEISLSLQGRRTALALIRRHRLIETYLWVHLGYSWAEVHTEANFMEHTVSDKFIEKIAKKLGNPDADVHGDPIPDTSGEIIQQSLTRLTNCQSGQKVRISRVLDQSEKSLNYLEKMGLFIGLRAEILEIPEADSFVRFTFSGMECILGRELAEQIMVSLI
jgi:DtxR family transcriptional regulator, Mn-dependent transcriptional regulator